MLQFIPYYSLMMGYDTILLEYLFYYMLSTLQLYILYDFIFQGCVSNIKEEQFYVVHITLLQFIWHYLLLMDHDAIILVYPCYYIPNTLPLYFHIYQFTMDRDSFLHQEFNHSQLIKQLKNYHLYQMQMDITNIMELEYFIHVISFIQFILFYFLYIYYVSINLVYPFYFQPITLQQYYNFYSIFQVCAHILYMVFYLIQP